MLAARLPGFKIVPCLAFILGGWVAPATRAAVTLPGKVVVEEVDFERHLMGLFGRMGCNAGSCHGSFQGKGGFRLSLFGYDPGKDYAALTRDIMGRRINPVDPDRSLFLLKATGQIEHGGGRRFTRTSWQYQLFREWILNGARWEKGSGDVQALTVTPDEYATIAPKEIGKVRVRARFADDSEADVTALCDLRVQDDAIAEVTGPGEVRALRPGDTALVVSYRGNVRAIRILVPMPAKKGSRYPKVPQANYIDREVFAKLRQLNMVPSDLAGDAEFLRRVTIDTIGCLPAPEEVRAFLADRSVNKRAKKIEELLVNPMHGALWATKFSDITSNNPSAKGKGGPLQLKYAQMWQDWFRKRFAGNMPYDEIVRGVLCATSRDGKKPEEWLKEVKELEEAAAKGFETPYPNRASLDLFWFRGKASLEQLGEQTAAAFLGIRLECAQCHKHPFDRWTQKDYRAYANVFGQVAQGVSPEVLQVLYQGKPPPPKVKGKKVKGKGPGVFEVYIGGKARRLADPDIPQVVVAIGKKNKPVYQKAAPLPARALGGPEIPLEPGQDARVALFDWMRSPDNPYFARSFVNRVWCHYFGVGLVDPVDNFSLANPPSNARLLDALAKDFIQHQFDIRHLERTVLNSRVYQLTSATNETNQLDLNNYAHSYLRPMMAEVVVDVLNSALGAKDYFGPEAPVGARAIEVGTTRLPQYAFRVFGRPMRTMACDCERSRQPALPQTLYLMTDPEILGKLLKSSLPLAKLSPKQFGGKVKVKGKGKVKLPGQTIEPQEGRLAQLLRSNLTDDQLLEELFLATLTRLPTSAEKEHFAAHRAAKKNRLQSEPIVEAPKKKKIKQMTAGLSERQAAFVDALWALVNTREFILNH